VKSSPAPIPVHVLALARLPGVGRRRLRTLLSRIGPAPITSARELADAVRQHGAGLRLRVEPAMAQAAWDEGDRMASLCQRHGWRAWVLGAAGYPATLKRLEDPPALLLVHGDDQPETRPRVAVIGTRDASSWGERTAAACAHAVVGAGGIVVSGLAWGIDTAAHRATVAARGCTWSILPSALDVIFPPSNTALAAEIVETGGALITEYLPGTRPRPTFFVERDRLQAAFADLVVVVETGLTGGTLHTVRFARGLGVPLLVTFPPDLDPARVPSCDALPVPQQGTWSLLQAGATRVTPDDVGRLARERFAGSTPQARPSQGRLFDGDGTR
jgi:DNA processing protein